MLRAASSPSPSPADVASQLMQEVPAPRHGVLRAFLLLVWASVSFGACYFARDLQFTAAGWPFGYWMAAQGILLVFIVLVTVYATVLNRAERRATQADEDVAATTSGKASARA